MVRIIIKGGVWKNTEDEVLKAAVMKYGKNEWARISSLLTRKTPKQCKARWFEWLDPSVKKMDWSREEDEKLLHMAKLMPTQWRTIAPVVGRTPSQCLERYQQLLDDADVGDEGPTGDDVRKLRPGEIDPNPESKPARPDPIDMDEDEKEMLSEARARLANTQGKKAKRKAREKQLADARRISNLQKKRELKNAGIELKEKRERKGMDYSKDIPFHHPQPSGFYDINNERIRELGEKRDLSNALMEQLEGKRRLEVELEERKKDFKKQKMRKNDDENSGLDQKSQALQSDLLHTARKKLMLPPPQVTEQDVQDIVKMGVSGQSAREMMAANQTPATGFVGDYDRLTTPAPVRTPRVALAGAEGQDAVKAMARNLKALSESQTPLLGEQVKLEGEMAFDPTPQRFVAATPNVLSSSESGIRSTPRAGATPVPSTARDMIGINATPTATATATPMRNSFDETPTRQKDNDPIFKPKKSLKGMFAALPKPKNEFTIVAPEVDKYKEEINHSVPKVIDEEISARQKLLEDKRLEKEKLLLRSQSVQKSLPRPLLTKHLAKSFLAETQSQFQLDPDPVELMIQKEKLSLVYHDATYFPIPGQPALDKGLFKSSHVKLEELNHASELIKEEMSKTDHPAIKPPLLYQDFDLNGNQTYVLVTELMAKDYSKQYDRYLALMTAEATKSQKVEKKLNSLLGGYMARRKVLTKSFRSTYDQLDKAKDDLLFFSTVYENEKEFQAVRMEQETKEVARLAFMEQDLQDRYRNLEYERDRVV